MLTQRELKESLNYSKETGVFSWLKNSEKTSQVNSAGYLANLSSRKECNYRIICLKGKNYLAHRLAFLYVLGSFPTDFVDHINHDGSDNRWINLRDATRTENNRNTRKHHDNKSGICGVWLDRKIWVAKIGIGSKQICLGRFNNLFDAVCARKNAELLHGYHKNHGVD